MTIPAGAHGPKRHIRTNHPHVTYGFGHAVAHRKEGTGAGDLRVGNPSQEVLGSGYYNPYAGYEGPGSIVLNATERARREPGVTLELSPDAKETATGGPVGGVPGFDGM